MKTTANKAMPGQDDVSGKNESVAELMLEVAQFFFRIRAIGQKQGLITSWGAGAFGFMRSLSVIGPLTVPQIAEMRPTSRQRMQRLANELADSGLVEFVENPRHRRSKLARLTAEGEIRYQELNISLTRIAAAIGDSLDEADIRSALRVLKLLSSELKDKSTRGASDID